ncbi:mitochondrial carrier family protein [Pelomyxa schiedti]|nr:mitochondrial carrier family protein [Pelomyxa schiedti]
MATSASMSQNKEKKQEKAALHFLHFIAGGIGGVIGAVVTAPIDVAKTRLQASTKVTAPFGLRTASALRDIYYTDGFKGYFAGLGPTVYGVLPMRAMFFASSSVTEKQLAKVGVKKNSALSNLISSVIAGAVVQTAMCPVWVVKTRMILGNNSKDKKPAGTFTVMKEIYNTEGVRGLFGGLLLSYLGISENAIQFVLFEQLKLSLQEKRKKEALKLQAAHSKPGTTVNTAVSIKPQEPTALETFALASFSKLVASAVTYPHEVLRTRLRSGDSRYTGFIQCAKVVYAQEGVRGLYAGIAPHLLRVVPNAAVMMLTHDLIVSYGTKVLTKRS